MTQAFNLAQLANNLNTSGQLDATDGLSGLAANANLASSGTANSSTFLRGDRVWATAGLLAASQAQAEAGTDNTVSITPLSLRQGLNATGSAPIYACRSWINFNGTGTISIRGSGNVTDITDGGTGFYYINFTTAMPDVNYSAMAWGTFVQAERCGLNGTNITSAGYQIRTASSAGGADPAHVFSAAFR